jgi:hypothetical protein
LQDSQHNKEGLFLRIDKQTRTDGWNVIVEKLPTTFIENIQSIMIVSKSASCQTAIANTENLATTATNVAMTTTVSNVATTATNVATTATNMATTATNVAMPPPRITFPNPTNDIMLDGRFGLGNKEKTKFRRDQA